MSDILCIGSVLWDVIGHSPASMSHGADRPGRITRHPGGVALNIAMALQRFGLTPALLSAVGRDAEGDDLLRACTALGLDTAHIHRPETLPTDIYMAIEDPSGLIAAIADAHSLENAGASILEPLLDGTLGSDKTPFTGTIALDGNLTATLLDNIAANPTLAKADLRVAPASPGKAKRLTPFLAQGRATLYVNLEEAGLLCDTSFIDTSAAAHALLAKGARRVLVTHGAQPACDGTAHGLMTGQPPTVQVHRITGAGDCFMAAHIAAEINGADRQTALTTALSATAAHISKDIS